MRKVKIVLPLAIMASCALLLADGTTEPVSVEPTLIPPSAAEIPLATAPSRSPATSPSDLSLTPPPSTTQPLPALPETAPSDELELATAPSGSQLNQVVVTSDLDRQREYIAPALGATEYTIGPDQIKNTPGGEDASFQQVLLRAPGVVADSFGQFHVRGEHANVTYRVNGVLLPQPITSFGQEIDTHLVQSFTLIDGSLPAQFGFHTAGIIDVQTKTGANLNGGSLSLYGGSYNTFQPAVEYGFSSGKWDVFLAGSYLSNSHGIENPTDSNRPIHDDTSQTRGFTYIGYNIDDTSRISLILNGYYCDYQIPNTPGVAPQFTLNGVNSAQSADLNERQNEQEYYSLLSYQKTIDRFSVVASGFYRYGVIHYVPDTDGDLIFQGTAGNVKNTFGTVGTQVDSAYRLNDEHTVRAGLIFDYTLERQDTDTAVFATDSTGAQASSSPTVISDSTKNTGAESGIYLQDEWKFAKGWTLNYGGRYDRFDSTFDTEDGFSPRANLVWNATPSTTVHGGYSRYFVAPPVQNVFASTLAKFRNTTNAPGTFADDPPLVEHSNYYDLGVHQDVTKAFSVDLDGFYKEARNLIDLGQFGNALILAPYNYRRGDVYGVDLSTNYKQDNFSSFTNVAWEDTTARDVVSQQYQFDPDELNYIANHNVHLDHEAEWEASGGVSYKIGHNDQVYADVVYSSGLRAGFGNTLVEPSSYPVQVGWEHIFHPTPDDKNLVRFRLDVVNVFDEKYQIRDGNGIGTSSPQYGQRRSFFAGLSYEF